MDYSAGDWLNFGCGFKTEEEMRIMCNFWHAVILPKLCYFTTAQNCLKAEEQAEGLVGSFIVTLTDSHCLPMLVHFLHFNWLILF